MQKHGYRDLAHLYDVVTSNKDYVKEVDFLKKIFEDENIHSVLDVGCGTGTHMKLLEEEGFRCDGLDLSEEMLEVAEEKVKGDLFHADMANFYLEDSYDAVICMYASFNHLLDEERARNTLKVFKEHLKEGGLVVIDLHVPHGDGEKTEEFNGVTRKMQWSYDEDTGMEETDVVFQVDGEEIHDHHTMKIYSPSQLERILVQAGFGKVRRYREYSLSETQGNPKNVQVVAEKI